MPAGIAAGYLADVVFADPRRGHPVAGFGWCASALERFSYRDSRGSGVLHTVALVTGVAGVGALAQRRAAGGVPLTLLAAATPLLGLLQGAAWPGVRRLARATAVLLMA